MVQAPSLRLKCDIWPVVGYGSYSRTLSPPRCGVNLQIKNREEPKIDSALQAAPSKSLKIYWDKVYAYRTDCFIKWCTDNPTQRVKLFSDLTQDAREEGRNKSQLKSTKKGIYNELARYIFENEVDVAADWKSRPHVFVAVEYSVCH